VLRPERIQEVIPRAPGPFIARGQGRSYGDAALLKEGTVVLTERLNRLLSFDEETGILRAEAGVTIADLLETFVPRGWFPPVTPGTKFVSLGGCVAADVHGKNHHRAGAFGAHVLALELALPDGTRRRCTPESDADLFRATVGGMGLTGIILEVTLRLRRIETAFMVVRNHAAPHLDAVYDLLEREDRDDETSVAWIDAGAGGARLGCGIVIAGHHATRSELPAQVDRPLALRHRRVHELRFDLPAWALNRPVLRAFNRLYGRAQGRRSGPFLVDHDPYFYPLDRIGHWNRLYGREGFLQHQCVIPASSAHEGVREILEAVTGGPVPCFLAVLKRFGAAGSGLLSFPLAGYTLALDFPVAGGRTLAFLDALDAIVLRHGGRVYLAKDARLRRESFQAMYPEYPRWRKIKESIDPADLVRSELSVRLGLGAPA